MNKSLFNLTDFQSFNNIPKYLLILFGVFLIFSLLNYVYISNYAKHYLASQLNELPYNKVALLLGTSPRSQKNRPNPYFIKRIQAAKRLLENRKIDLIIVSGDNRTVAYNEPKYMRDYLEALGVASSTIISDYAGRRTLDSVLRVQKIFEQNNVTIVSQEYHNERAIFLARKNGIEAIGFNAEDIKKEDFESSLIYFLTKSKNIIREILARDLATLDLLLGKQPEILGEIVEIR